MGSAERTAYAMWTGATSIRKAQGYGAELCPCNLLSRNATNSSIDSMVCQWVSVQAQSMLSGHAEGKLREVEPFRIMWEYQSKPNSIGIAKPNALELADCSCSGLLLFVLPSASPNILTILISRKVLKVKQLTTTNFQSTWSTVKTLYHSCKLKNDVQLVQQ